MPEKTQKTINLFKAKKYFRVNREFTFNGHNSEYKLKTYKVDAFYYVEFWRLNSLTQAWEFQYQSNGIELQRDMIRTCELKIIEATKAA